MRILFVANYSPNDLALGISQKIKAQIETLRSMGNEVYYTAYDKMGIAIFDNNNNPVEIKDFPIKIKKIFRFARMFFLVKTARKYASKNNFDLAFVRWGGLGKDVIKMLRVLKKQCRYVVMDTHGYFKGERGSGIIGRYITGTTERNKTKVHGLIDLVLSETKEKELFGAPSQTYDNGVNVSGTRKHSYIGDREVMNMISVANERIYHGYDRVIKSVAEYKKKGLPVKFHLVGVISPQTESMVSKLGLSDDVIIYGKQCGTALDDIYDKCNIGVGPVGQHRVGGKMGTGLKTKEYFARGIPYFYSGSELMVPEGYPYILEIPSNESIIDLELVYTFCMDMKDKHVASDMREFAEKNFSWEKNFAKMFENLKNKDMKI